MGSSKNGNDSKQGNMFYYVCDTNKNQTENKNNVIFFRNEDFLTKVNLTKVNRQKLLEKSGYYRAILKPCFKDHKSDSIKLQIPGSCQVFTKVMHFINTNIITLDIETVLETCHLALYLQIDCLPQLCFDHFTHNLNQNTLEKQLHLMTKYSYLDKEFKERALLFEASGRPSYSGFYILEYKLMEENCVGKYLKSFSKDFKSHHMFLKLKNDTNSERKNTSSLHYFDLMICFVVLKDMKWFLCQYDLLSGKSSMLIINENVEYMVRYTDYLASDRYEIPVVCSNDNKLFIISKTVNKDEVSLLLSVFQRNNVTACLKMCKQIRFFATFGTHMYFSHCYDDKIYIFYRKSSMFDAEPESDYENIYLLTICEKSLRVLKNQKLSTKSKTLAEGILDEDTEITDFEKMFVCQKQEKLFIRMTFYHYDDLDDKTEKKVLIFDMKNDFFYCGADNVIPSISLSPHSYEMGYLDFTLGKDGIVYGTYQYVNPYRKINVTTSGFSLLKKFNVWTEIRAFRLENDKLVYDGVKFKDCSDRSNDYISSLKSTCFV